MRHGLRFRHVLMGALGLALCACAAARADDPPKKFKPYEIPTADGVRLAGYLWSNAAVAERKDATVILLHDFDYKKGGSSRDTGWDDLAEKLQDKGYSVFSFDFRGFGESTKIDPKLFWNAAKNPQNRMLRTWGRMPVPETISYTDFDRAYYPYLVNDLIAVKAWLDGRNDAGDINTSSVFVIGAGQGATIGALWMDAEWHLQKGNLDFTNSLVRDPKTGQYSLQDPEGSDQAGAIWLSISPTLAERPVTSSLHSWLGEVGGANHVPMAFFYGGKEGKDGKEGRDMAGGCLKAIITGYRREKGGGSLSEAEASEKNDEKPPPHSEWKLPDTLKAKIGDDTTLSGNKLLTDDLPTAKYIVGGLNKIMADRKNLVAKQRHDDAAAYFWVFGRTLVQCKMPMDPTPPIFEPNIETKLMR